MTIFFTTLFFFSFSQDIVSVVKRKTEASIARLGQNGIKILNLVVNKPNIPPDIAANYKQVRL